MSDYLSNIKSTKLLKSNQNIKNQKNKKNKTIKNAETNINNNRINESKINPSSNLETMNNNISKVSKSICKLQIQRENKTINGTGFLLALQIEKEIFYFLISNEHVIKKRYLNKNIKIYISYDNQLKSNYIELNNNKRYMKSFTDNNLDITIVEILDEDNIAKELFLSPESEEKINNKLINNEIYIPQYPDDKLITEKGKIKKINTKYEFTHSTNTDFGSSGSPIFLENSIKVLGIHKQGNRRIKENYGNFIYPAINFIENDLRKIRNIGKNKIEDEKHNRKEVKKNLSNTKFKKYNNKALFITFAIISLFATFLLDFIYKSIFKNDKTEKERTVVFLEGEYYIGQYENGIRNGKGIMYYSNGNVKYDGDWLNGNIEGYGRFNWKNGYYYIGQWKKCVRSGKGAEY